MPANLRRWKAKEELTSENFNQRTTELENYLNEQENKNINSDKVVFSDGETFQQKLDAGTLRGEKGEQGQTGERGPQGLQGNVDTTEIRQIKSEAEEHLRKAIQLLRSVQVNVQGTVLETQFMKKATFDKDNDGVVDKAKTLNNIVKAIDLSSQVQMFEYRKSVIALCEIGVGYSYSQGNIYFRRPNGQGDIIPFDIKVTFQQKLNGNVPNCSIIQVGMNALKVKGCTFRYNSKLYSGIEFYADISRHEKCEFVGVTNFNIFGVDYMNTQSSVALANSIRYDDVEQTREVFVNGNKLLHSSNIAKDETIAALERRIQALERKTQNL